ncbi:MAG: hypothetical protein JSS99_05730 [Actinobacteria bacterium]|nr:hypothetical protein [Actinomycetota bacterium]
MRSLRVLLAPVAVLALLPSALLGSGCSSTRAQAAKFTQEGDKAFAARGLRVGAANRDVQLVERAVLSDANGTAAVVVLKNRGTQALAGVPLALAVKDAHGKLLWRNDAPGLEPGLTHVALLAPGQTVTWVNDQVLTPPPPAPRPAALAAKAGAGAPAPPTAARLDIAVRQARLEGDPASGVTAVANAVNGSGVDQRDLVVAAVARRGGKLVAAGRAIVPLLRAHGHERFQVFFVGDPRGAELHFDAQPSTLGGAR